MKTSSTCCGGSTTTSCDTHIAELPRYYPRQLITPDDLTLEQNYFRDRLRRHNRLLHGWGVVCGALVCPLTTKDVNGVVSLAPWQVLVQTGYILGPYGDEIVLDCVRTIDLRTRGVSGVTGDPCVDVPDPWCSQVTVPRNPGPLYIAVKYKQSMTRPVRVQPIGCGCDDTSCECSRWHDGYEIGVLTCCPTDGETPPAPGDIIKGDIPTCPDCPSQPWVVLASVQVEVDGTITSIDNCACRRMVASASRFWWSCTQGSTTLTGPKATQVKAGATTKITINGTNLYTDATYTFGNGISVSVIGSASGPQSTVDLNVAPDDDADPGSRTLIVVNEDCSTVTLADAIEVVAAPQKVAPKSISVLTSNRQARKLPVKKNPTPATTPTTPPVQP